MTEVEFRFREHSPEHLSTIQIPLVYDPNAKCPNILKFFGQILKPKDVFTVIQLFGYCLYRTTKYEKAVLLIGKGANGKSTLLRLLETFLGTSNVSHVSLQELGSDRFASAELWGKLANIFADLKADKLMNSGPFKMLTSGDSIRAQRKFSKPFDFVPYAKLFFSANEVPESTDQTYAFFRRWIILHFERVFEGENVDVHKIEKLTTKEELSGLLNLALIGLKQLIKDNGFKHLDDIEAVRKEYEENSNNVIGFLSSEFTMTGSDDDYIICREMWSYYVKYCKKKKLTAKHDNVFGLEMNQLHVKKQRIRVNKAEREYCYLGIKPKPKDKNDGERRGWM
jgi:P4 family phage/plasmid primase-like protien